MPGRRLFGLTLLAMLAFAGNSLLCRVALKETMIDPISFTTIRLISGALMLGLLLMSRRGAKPGKGNWISGVALLGYALCFSLAYRTLPAATGALILFGAVQVTMLGTGIWQGERLAALQLLGLASACGGIVLLLMPGLAAPSLSGSLLMAGGGLAWGIYSLRGRQGGDPTAVTAGNFKYAALMAMILSLVSLRGLSLDHYGCWLAVASGALTSGLGYAIWYYALPGLKANTAATVQLSVPLLAAAGGVVFLGESLTLRLLLASIAVLGGIALIIFNKAGPVTRLNK